MLEESGIQGDVTERLLRFQFAEVIKEKPLQSLFGHMAPSAS